MFNSSKKKAREREQETSARVLVFVQCFFRLFFPFLQNLDLSLFAVAVVVVVLSLIAAAATLASSSGQTRGA